MRPSVLGTTPAGALEPVVIAYHGKCLKKAAFEEGEGGVLWSKMLRVEVSQAFSSETSEKHQARRLGTTKKDVDLRSIP